jgi:antitoxin (DNA-binding transcriptional repressor) of toxin-antitoxin stability system
MEAIAVVNIQNHFSEILKEVRNGKKVGIMYDGLKTPVAMIVPYIEEKKAKRKIGILDGKATFKEIGDGKITMEEFLGL